MKNYNHKMNKKAFQELEQMSYKYYLKKNWQDDYKIILDNFDYHRSKRKMTNSENKLEFIKNLPAGYGRNNEIKILLTLQLFLEEQKQIMNECWLGNNWQDKTAELFHKYFAVTGDFMKTITLKPLEAIGE